MQKNCKRICDCWLDVGSCYCENVVELLDEFLDLLSKNTKPKKHPHLLLFNKKDYENCIKEMRKNNISTKNVKLYENKD